MTIAALFLSGPDGVTGLIPTIVIVRDDTSAVVASGTMSEVGEGRYKYEYAETSDIPYSFICDGGELLDPSQRIKGGSFCVDSIPGAIKAKTDNLPVDPADESLLEAAIATRAAPGAEMALIDGAVTTAKAPNLDAAVSTRALETGGNLATVMGKTNNLPSDPADESLLEAAIATRAAPGAAMTLTAAYDAAKTAAQTGDAMALTGAQVTAIITAILQMAYSGVLTFQSLLQRIRAVCYGVSTVTAGHQTFMDTDDVTPLVEADVDVDGQRSGVDAHGG